MRITREVILWHGDDRIDFRTHVDGSIGQDRLLRVRFDLDLPGSCRCPKSVSPRSAAPSAFPTPTPPTTSWTLDNPAHTWAGLSATARIRLHRRTGGPPLRHRGRRGDRRRRPRRLLVALAGQGVAATRTRPDGPRYGALDVDSNLPDVRIVGGPGNPFAAGVLARGRPGLHRGAERPRPGVRARRAAPRAGLGAGRGPARHARPAGPHRRRRPHAAVRRPRLTPRSR